MANSAFIVGQPLAAGGSAAAATSVAIALNLLGADPERGAGESREKSECAEKWGRGRGTRWSRNDVGVSEVKKTYARDWGA